MIEEFQTTGRNDLGQDVAVFDAPDLSPTQITEHCAGQIANAIESTGLVEVVETMANMVNQVHFQCRVKDSNAREVAHSMVHPLIRLGCENEAYDFFLGKQFLEKKGKIVFAWIFSFSASDIQGMTRDVIDAIDHLNGNAKKEVLETPLMGSGTPMSAGQGSRGARPLK